MRSHILWLLLACPALAQAPASLGKLAECDAYLFEAYFTKPAGAEARRDQWLMPSAMHSAFERAPLASYSFFRKLEFQKWQLEMLKPLRMEFPFLQRLEITYLEARITSLGQVFYRFAYKVNHLRNTEFTLDLNESAALFLQHARTHDIFLHLTCRAR